jgi:hypothetical protein
MLAETPAAYVWETNRGLYILEADEDLLFFRALRALHTARTVGDLWEVDGRLGLELNAGWDDMWSIVPTEEDFERFDQGSDDSKQAAASLARSPRHCGLRLRVHRRRHAPPVRRVAPRTSRRGQARLDGRRVPGSATRAARARLLLEQHGIRLVDEPALADAFEGQS